jgi:hypothetical protein
MSFRDIPKIINAYDKRVSLESNHKEQNNPLNQKIKKPPISSRAFILFRKGKKPSEVKVLLDIQFKKAIRYWVQYLKSIRMYESFEFYREHSYDIPALLSIVTFIKRNNISGKDNCKCF